ncbi:hypothetical protein Y032_0024g885 [Ancylostoma ceylanicum]|uniref:Uncharacterized protein n=1 Tax=Ancylostoma ceylanicum TaxID=53326 RepID=A0A016UVN1_9BILA|nr:hypothetical protein Y032_0024g885 [Ancylostoma ceylanicum]
MSSSIHRDDNKDATRGCAEFIRDLRRNCLAYGKCTTSAVIARNSTGDRRCRIIRGTVVANVSLRNCVVFVCERAETLIVIVRDIGAQNSRKVTLMYRVCEKEATIVGEQPSHALALSKEVEDHGKKPGPARRTKQLLAGVDDSCHILQVIAVMHLATLTNGFGSGSDWTL